MKRILFLLLLISASVNAQWMGQRRIKPGIGSFTEEDPTVNASVKAITATDISNWNSSFSWGNHSSAGYLTSATAATTYVPIDGTSTISGAKTFSTTITSASILPNADNTRTLGNASFQYQTTYTRNILGTSLFFSTIGSTNMSFGINSGATTIGTWYSDGNLLVQTGGTQTNGGFKFDVTGTSRLNGNITIGGNIIPSVDVTNSLGGAANRYQYGYIGTLIKPTGSGMNFAVTGSTDIFTRIHPDGTWHLQAAGAVPSPSGYRLSVSGTTLLNGQLNLGASVPVYADNAAATTGGLAVGEVYRTSTGVLMIRY